jgi:polyphosphate kinase
MMILEAGDESTYLMGSPDLMPRNLDSRVEMLVPVQDARARRKMAGIFDALLSDNAQAWSLRSDGSWKRLRTKKGERAQSAQTMLMRTATARGRRASSRRS